MQEGPKKEEKEAPPAAAASPAEDPSQDAELVFAYTWEQAIADGVLVDVTGMAKEAGFRYPVSLTSNVWDTFVRVPEGVEAQDEAGRLWDILTMLRFAIKQGKDGSELLFQLHVRNENERARLVTLKSVCGPDGNGSPCITIMLPDEARSF